MVTEKESIKRGGFGAYLIFVIFFTRTKFLENKIYTMMMKVMVRQTERTARTAITLSF